MANNKKIQPKNEPQKINKIATKGDKKEPSKQEIMFFRVGMIVITLTVVIASVIMLITYFVNKDETDVPFENQLSITQDDLTHLMIKDPLLGYVVDQDYFTKYDNYSTFRSLILNNNVIYIYFYRSSEINSESEAIIELKDYKDLAIFFLDLDSYSTIYTDPTLNHIGLEQKYSEMLLVFDTVEQTFELQYRVTDIHTILNQLGK